MKLLSTLTILILISLVVCEENYYKLLEIPKNANPQQIKKAFKKLAIKYHPDKQTEENKESALKKFQKISNAFDILSDPEKRRVYDQGGIEALNQYEQSKNSGQRFNAQDFYKKKEEEQEYFLNSDVLQLKMDTLTKLYRRNQVWLILFYRPGADQEAERIKNVWMELANKYYGVFKVAAVDCDNDSEICEQEFETYDYPSVFCASSNALKGYLKYSGSIEVKPIAKFGIHQMENFVWYVTEENYQEFINFKPQLNKILLFTEKKSLPAMYQALSKELKNTLVLGVVKRFEQNLIKKFKISKFPTVLVITEANKYQAKIYDGTTRNKDQLTRFLRQYQKSEEVIPKQNAGIALELIRGLEQNSNTCNQFDNNLCFIYLIDQNGSESIGFVEKLAKHYTEDQMNFFYVQKYVIDYQLLQEEEEQVNSLTAIIIRGKKHLYYPIYNTSTENDFYNIIDEVLSNSKFSKEMNGQLGEYLNTKNNNNKNNNNKKTDL